MRKWIFTIFITGILGIIPVKAQNEKFKALFIYNFTNYIEWPSNNEGTFLISVLGNSPIIDELKIISTKKKVGTSTIIVKKISDPSEIGESKICYIPISNKKKVDEISMALKNKPILIITDEATSSYGINFIETGQKQAFLVNKTNIEAHGLKVSSTLLSLSN
jgi:hypothetical protein